MTIDGFRRIFFPSPEEVEEDDKKLKTIHDELAKDRGCVTCKNKIHIVSFPGFVMGEEWKCTKGLDCDTVLCRIKNCPEWEEDEVI